MLGSSLDRACHRRAHAAILHLEQASNGAATGSRDAVLDCSGVHAGLQHHARGALHRCVRGSCGYVLCAASSRASARGRPIMTPPSAMASRNSVTNAGPDPASAVATSKYFSSRKRHMPTAEKIVDSRLRSCCVRRLTSETTVMPSRILLGVLGIARTTVVDGSTCVVSCSMVTPAMMLTSILPSSASRMPSSSSTSPTRCGLQHRSTTSARRAASTLVCTRISMSSKPWSCIVCSSRRLVSGRPTVATMCRGSGTRSSTKLDCGTASTCETPLFCARSRRVSSTPVRIAVPIVPQANTASVSSAVFLVALMVVVED